jgi:hypothetical protein
MKTFLVLVIGLFSVISASAQSIHFPDSNAIWSVYMTKYFVNGDSVVNEKVYKKYYSTEDSTFITSNFFALLREDTISKEVFVIPSRTYEEKLLYDFSIILGDSVTVFPDRDYTAEYDLVPVIARVIHIDSVIIDGNLRKRYEISNNRLVLSEQWIEGIGSTYGIFNSGVANTDILYIPRLLCFEQDGEIIYSDTIVFGCSEGYPNGINEKKRNDFVNIYPNPVGKLLFFDAVSEISEILIFASSGIALDKFEPNNNEYQISVTDYPSGIYYLKITGRNFIQNLKFIKQ